MSTLKVGTIQDHANSNTAITIDSAGRIKTPQTPLFIAYRMSNYTLDTSYSELIYDQEDVDIGGNYDVSNGRFTAPIDGLYEFAVASIDSAHASCVRQQIRINGVITGSSGGGNYEHRKDHTGMGSAAGYSTNSEYCAYINLTAGQYVSVFHKIDSGSLTAYGNGNYRYNYFRGKLII